MSQESQRLEFLGEMAGGLAHEIKNPLSTMKLQLELMEEEFREQDSPASRKTLPKVELLLKEIRRLQDIVQEFLKIARGHDLKLTAVDVERVLGDLVDFVRPEADREHVRLSLRIHGAIGTVLLDENYFHRAMLNLVQNAIQACIPKRGGDVIIEAGRRGNALAVAVIDTGVGIPEGVRDRVFRAYFTTRPGGTGMGLPLTRRIIEEHGGYIGFDTVEGQGSRFMIMLPVSTDENLSQLMIVDRNVRREIHEHEVAAAVNDVLARADGGASSVEKPSPASDEPRACGTRDVV